MRSPFHSLENLNAYEFYRATFLGTGKKPCSEVEFKADNLKLFERGRDSLKKLIKKAKEYKCYAL
jgi:hypothetical protein